MSVFGNLSGLDAEQGGFGPHAFTLKDVQALTKAAYSGYDNGVAGIAGFGNMGPLRPQSLDRTLHIVTSRFKHLKMWPAIRKGPAFSVNEEFTRMLSFGDPEIGIWASEGQIGEEVDSQYERVNTKMRYATVTGRITLPTLLTQPAYGSISATETANKTLFLLSALEPALYLGDSSLDSKQIDGIFTQVLANAPNNIIDAHGGPLTQPLLDDAILFGTDSPNHAMLTTVHLAPKVKSSFVKGFYPTQRSDLFNTPKNASIGGTIGSFEPTSALPVTLVDNVFIKDGGPAPTASAGAAGKIPLAPVIVTAAACGADATVSKFVSGDDVLYKWWVAAANSAGRSEAVSCGTATAAVGDSMTVVVRPGAGGPLPEYYILYRTKASDAATASSGLASAAGYARRIIRVANSNGAAAQTLKDVNYFMPGCTIGFIMQMDEIVAKQLAPMMRIMLGQQDLTVRWANVLFLLVQVLAPTHMIMIRNLATLSDTIVQVA